MANFMDKDDDLDAAFVCKRVTHGVTICILYGYWWLNDEKLLCRICTTFRFKTAYF